MIIQPERERLLKQLELQMIDFLEERVVGWCEAVVVVAVVCAEGTKRTCAVETHQSSFTLNYLASLHQHHTLSTYTLQSRVEAQILRSECRLMISWQPRAEPWKARVAGHEPCQLDSLLRRVLREHSMSCRGGDRSIS
jgi:hypothetical protein